MPKVTKLPIMPKIKEIMDWADKKKMGVSAYEAGLQEALLTLPAHPDTDSSNTHPHFRHFRHFSAL
jgi:hypothetical protein